MSNKIRPHYADAKGIIIADFERNGLICAGRTVPTDGTAGYAAGALFFDVDAADGSQVFVNEGSATSCDFNALNSNTIANSLAVQSAYTQTYSTADKTVAAPTATTLTDSSGGATADGTIGAVTAPTALVDSTGGTADNTVSAVGATNGSDVSGTINNNFKEFITAQAADRAAIVALTDAVKELSGGLNKVIADDLDLRQAVTALIDDLQALGLVG